MSCMTFTNGMFPNPVSSRDAALAEITKGKCENFFRAYDCCIVVILLWFNNNTEGNVSGGQCLYCQP